MRLEQYTREEAAQRTGIEEVAALPTGLILMETDCFAGLDVPHCYYEYEDATESNKASTEDVTLTRDLGLNGVPQFVNWSAWAGHWKWKCVVKPRLLTSEMIGQKFRNKIQREALDAQPIGPTPTQIVGPAEDFGRRANQPSLQGAAGAGGNGGRPPTGSSYRPSSGSIGDAIDRPRHAHQPDDA
jgi:hypothetical protein